MKHDHWLRCERARPSTVFGVGFIGTRIHYGAPFAMAVVKRHGLRDVRRFRTYAESHGFVCTVLRGHDGPCCFEVN